MSETREQRQTRLDAKVAELRAAADRKEAEAVRIRGAVNDDPAFWTQPAYGNAAGRAFAAHRNRERNKLIKAAKISQEAEQLRSDATVMESRGAVMAGDAAATRAAKVDACAVQVGQDVHTTHYGIRKVLKVNAKTVLVEGSFGPLKVEKQYVRAVA